MRHNLVMTIVLGSQYERRLTRQKGGRVRWEGFPGAKRFADLFPGLVGREVQLSTSKSTTVGLEMVAVMQWLGENGWLTHGGRSL